MSSLLGFLGGVADSMDPQSGPSYLTRLNQSVTPELAEQQRLRDALAALPAEATPMQRLNALAAVSPDFAAKAATITSGANTPSSLKELAALQQMTPEQQEL